MKNYIKGNYRKTIFSTDKGYTVGLFKIRETNDEAMKEYLNKTVTFTGYFDSLNMNEQYIFYGEGMVHPKYNFQYAVKEYERVRPDTKDGVVEFLSCGLFKGIGEKTARNIAEALGEKALDLIFEDPNNLLKVKGITKKKKDEIFHVLSEYEDSHNTYIYLCDLGFNMKEAMAIYSKYKKQTIDIVKNNVYTIYNDIMEVSFEKVDNLREKLEIVDNDERRIKALIIYVLKNLCYKEGHTYLHKEDINRSIAKYLGFEFDVDEILKDLIIAGEIAKKDDKYYLMDYYLAEHKIASTLKTMDSKSRFSKDKIEAFLEVTSKDQNITYNDDQKKAIVKSLENKVTVISGGPGTGKSTIIKAIVEVYRYLNDLTYDELKERVAILAPTGRASKRLASLTTLPATTIHRYLKWDKDSNTFSINEYNKNYEELIIVDEVSMVDTLLLSSLFKGLTTNIQLVLVGDYNQLPSVGPGEVLKDIIESETVDVVELKKLYRQSENSYILTLAGLINSGELDLELDKKDDFSFIPSNEVDLLAKLVNLAGKLMEKKLSSDNTIFLVPMYKGLNGIDNINVKLQEIYNPKQAGINEISLGDVIFRENDKVIQLQNDPDNNVFNGDLGKITSIIKNNDGQKSIYIDFDGNEVKYEVSDLYKIKHGYAISIHKAQGSEFKNVIIPLVNSYNLMLYRKLIYTGVTRAKENLVIIGDRRSLLRAISNNNAGTRNTTLKELLKNN